MGGLLRVSIIETTTVHTDVDMVAYFTGLTPLEQKRYRAMDPGSFLNPGEHEWPMEFLVPREEGVGHSDWSGCGVYPGFPDYEADARVANRPIPGAAASGYWTREDFEHLVANVPWMSAFHDERRVLGSRTCDGCGERIRPDDRSPTEWAHVAGGWVTDHPVEPRPIDRIMANHGFEAAS